jgi:hypothetical protein
MPKTKALLLSDECWSTIFEAMLGDVREDSHKPLVPFRSVCKSWNVRIARGLHRNHGPQY